MGTTVAALILPDDLFAPRACLSCVATLSKQPCSGCGAEHRPKHAAASEARHRRKNQYSADDLKRNGRRVSENVFVDISTSPRVVIYMSDPTCPSARFGLRRNFSRSKPHFAVNCWEDDECLNALIDFPKPVPALFAAVWANKKKAQRFV